MAKPPIIILLSDGAARRASTVLRGASAESGGPEYAELLQVADALELSDQIHIVTTGPRTRAA